MSDGNDGEEEGEGSKGDGDEGSSDRGNKLRNNNDGLAPLIVQQAALHLALASLDDMGEDESTGRRLAYTLRTDDVGDDRTMTTMMATSSCRPLA